MRPDTGSDPADVFDVLADDYARRILVAANRRPMSAKALSEACDASLPTIYRRVSTLCEHELLDERTVVDEAGGHRSVYRTTVESVRADLGADGFSVVVDSRDDLADSFTALWSELRK